MITAVFVFFCILLVAMAIAGTKHFFDREWSDLFVSVLYFIVLVVAVLLFPFAHEEVIVPISWYTVQENDHGLFIPDLNAQVKDYHDVMLYRNTAPDSLTIWWERNLLNGVHIGGVTTQFH